MLHINISFMHIIDYLLLLQDICQRDQQLKCPNKMYTIVASICCLSIIVHIQMKTYFFKIYLLQNQGNEKKLFPIIIQCRFRFSFFIIIFPICPKRAVLHDKITVWWNKILNIHVFMIYFFTGQRKICQTWYLLQHLQL